MNFDLVNEVTASQLKTDIPPFRSGATIRVDVMIREGNKTRIQGFEGIVIKRQGQGINETVTVRKMSSQQIGVERTFPIHSPIIKAIKVLKHGKVRRSKLYYMRGLSGKASRLKEVRQ